MDTKTGDKALTQEALAAEVERLQRMIRELVSRSEDIQRVQQRFRDFEYHLLNATTFKELMDVFLIKARSHFKLQATSFIALDENGHLADLISETSIGYYSQSLQLRQRSNFFATLYAQKPRIILTHLDSLTSTRLFPAAGNVVSAALMPLVRHQKIIGSWHFGSDDAHRYEPSKGTDFLQHMASLAAICFENAVAMEQVQRQGMIDTLTQVKNRRSFEEEYPKELDRAVRTQQPLTCLFIDVDFFKSVNDRYGHAAGDACLKCVAQQVQTQLRKTDLLVRFGGEEFVVLMPACNDQQARQIAERIRAHVKMQPIDTGDGSSIHVTVSLGVATWAPADNQAWDESVRKVMGDRILQQADQAMYHAKAGGRNRVEQVKVG